MKLVVQGFSYGTYLMFNLCLCVDLVLLIRNPFGSKQNRLRAYNIISYSFGTINAFLFLTTATLSSVF